MEVIRVIHPCTHGNTIVRLLILAASWTALSRQLSLAYPEPCPSAQEGQTYALECTSKTQSHWKLSTLTEVCPQSGHLSCDWNKFGHVNVSKRQDGGKNISRLEFSTITHYFRNHTIQCVEEQTKTTEMSITECQMDIFLKPETVICDVLTLLHNHIRFTCQTSRIYPRLVCELRLRNEANNNTTNISPDIIYNDERLSSTEAVYYKSSCSVDILDLSPGTYSIYGVLTPAVKYTGYIGNMSFFIPKKYVVIYQPSPQVSVHLSGSVPTYICSDTPQTVIFNCHARMFQSRPHFKWLLLHLPVNQSQIDPNVEVYMNNETVYVSTCRINIEPFHVTIHVVCIANFSGHTAKDEFIKHLKRVQPVNPRFSVQSGEVISDSVLTIEGETQNISCQADTDDYQQAEHQLFERWKFLPNK